MEIMKIMKRGVVLVLSILLLIGCSPKNDIAFIYSDRAFECELSWELDGVRYRGTLTAGDIADTDTGERDISLTFAEPAALCGVRAERVDGNTRIYAQNIVFTNNEISGWLQIAELFRTDGDISESSLVTIGTEQTNRVALSFSDGTKVEVYLSNQSGAPIRVCGTVNGMETQADILRFEVKSPRE